ncbi:CRTAC1 family protein [Acidicapsa acidisoli]|uniref:CRTAC1 family protein n=1 Tax=Acidicapsa acidisoli TaxID=1615681 RepID=UPI0021E0855C|nr:CRTAC1 family protein [Acidicapsa acidisoli]
MSSGNSTGAAAQAIYDEQHRPITAGGFVDKGPVVFADISKQSGLASWSHVMGTPDKKYILDADGSGVGLLDYDNDGWLDIYLVNGSTFDALDGKQTPPHAALFRNNQDGTFTDVAEKAGVTNDRWGFGVAIGDFDNDGWPDIAVTNWGKNRLYRNNHDGTFTDVAEKAKITLGNWSSGVTWGDYDGDGRLDLFISGYVHFDRDQLPVSGSKVVGYAQCKFRGVVSMCGPRGLQGEPDHLFHNNGDGTFTDVSVKAGVNDPNNYYGFTSVFVDINNDGKPDLLVANDSVASYLYINKGKGIFEDDSYVSGFAVNKDGREVASMGLAVGDYENNGLLDIYDTDFSDDYKVLFHNDGDANFTDVSYRAGVAQTAIPFLGWGDGFLDYDNDGWRDIFEVNGHVYPDAGDHDWGTSYAERPLLFHNLKNGKFEYVPPVVGTGLADVIPARGAAFGDLFNDGKIDVVINPIDGPAVLLRNVNPDHHHWVELKLVGGGKTEKSPGSPRDAMCATVYLKANGMTQRDDVMSSGSYISSNDQRLHFGLGDATEAGTAEIHWPSGAKQTIKLPAVDRIYTISEDAGITGALCAGKPCSVDAAKPAAPK